MEEETYVDILNIFQKYFNETNGTNISMLDDIDNNDELGTNEQMEEFYEAMEQYNNFKDKYGKEPPIINPVLIDGRNCEKLYGLVVNGECVGVCISLMAIIIYLASINFENLNWKIKEI